MQSRIECYLILFIFVSWRDEDPQYYPSSSSMATATTKNLTLWWCFCLSVSPSGNLIRHERKRDTFRVSIPMRVSNHKPALRTQEYLKYILPSIFLFIINAVLSSTLYSDPIGFTTPQYVVYLYQVTCSH